LTGGLASNIYPGGIGLKRIGLLLLAVVVAIVMVGCGGGSTGPSGSTTDITGRWSLEINKSGHPFFINLQQNAAGNVTGSEEGQTTSNIDGQRKAGTSDYTLTILNITSGVVTLGNYNVTLLGDTFEGICESTINSIHAGPYHCVGTRS
jgi:hypothetical protein